MKAAIFNNSKECTFSCENVYINKTLLYQLFFRRYDIDGNEYNYNIIDLINDPSILDFFENI